MARPRKRPEDKDPTVTVSIRMPTDVHAEADRLAKADDRTLNVYVVRAVRAQNEAEKKKGGGR
jgi:predicted transcriptional regulator